MMRIILDGDANGGWLVEIHDGKEVKKFSPNAESARHALELALGEFYGDAVPEPTSGAGLMDPPGPLPDPAPAVEEPPVEQPADVTEQPPEQHVG